MLCALVKIQSESDYLTPELTFHQIKYMLKIGGRHHVHQLQLCLLFLLTLHIKHRNQIEVITEFTVSTGRANKEYLCLAPHSRC